MPNGFTVSGAAPAYSLPGQKPLSNTSPKNRLDIWQFSLTTEITNAHHLLNQEELERAARFHFPIHRTRFIAAHALQRLILARYLKCAANELLFDFNLHGKPYIPASDLQFNLSHSQNLALLAVGWQYEVGIDLEFFSARPYTGIGEHIYSVAENESLLKLAPMLKPLGFFHLWAQKEAIIKACGLGLSYPTKQLDMPIMPPVNQTIYDPLHSTSWHVRSFMPGMACCAAVCYKPEIEEIHFFKLEKNEIP